MSDVRPSRRAAYREATRRKILATARPLLLERGVPSTSIDDVAVAAGVSRATVYQHFAGLQVLLIALVVEDWDGQARLFAQLNPGSPPTLEAITRWLRRIVDGARPARFSFGMYRAALVEDDVGTGLHQQHRERLARLLCQQLLGRDPEHDAIAVRVEAAMIVAEIEHLTTAAAVVWRGAETAIAIDTVARRLLAFAEARAQS